MSPSQTTGFGDFVIACQDMLHLACRASARVEEQMRKAQVQEAIATLYVLLNGYGYLTSGFIGHSRIHGRNRAEVDDPGLFVE